MKKINTNTFYEDHLYSLCCLRGIECESVYSFIILHKFFNSTLVLKATPFPVHRANFVFGKGVFVFLRFTVYAQRFTLFLFLLIIKFIFINKFCNSGLVSESHPICHFEVSRNLLSLFFVKKTNEKRLVFDFRRSKLVSAIQYFKSFATQTVKYFNHSLQLFDTRLQII